MFHWKIAILALALPLLLTAPVAARDSGGSIDPKADQVLKQMSDYLGSLRQFAFKSTNTIDGRLSVLGNDTEIDAGPGDVVSNLQFGAMGYLGVRKGKWRAGFDVLCMALGATAAAPRLTIDVNEGAFTFTGLRQLHPRLDLLFGAR
jgi:hypothetical protein